LAGEYIYSYADFSDVLGDILQLGIEIEDLQEDKVDKIITAVDDV
jgi:hypothetical protein